MVTGKEVNNYTSWELQCPHSRSKHGTYNLGLFFVSFREMWFIDCSCVHLQGQSARRHGGVEL